MRELAAADPAALAAELGPALGPWYVQLGRGHRPGAGATPPRGCRAPAAARRPTRQNLTEWDEVRAGVAELARQVAADVAGEGRPAARVAVKVRFVPFSTYTRSVTLPAPTTDPATFEAAALEVLDRFTSRRAVRLLGVRAEFGRSLTAFDRSQFRVSWTVPTIGTPDGAGGRSSSTTGRPSSRAATSLAASSPPRCPG